MPACERSKRLGPRCSSLPTIRPTSSACVVRPFSWTKAEMLLFARPKEVVEKYHRLLFAAPEAKAALREQIRGATPAAAGVSELPSAAAISRGSGEDGSRFDPALVPESTVSYQARGAEIQDPRLHTSHRRAGQRAGQGPELCLQLPGSFPPGCRRRPLWDVGQDEGRVRARRRLHQLGLRAGQGDCARGAPGWSSSDSIAGCCLACTS